MSGEQSNIHSPEQVGNAAQKQYLTVTSRLQDILSDVHVPAFGNADRARDIQAPGK
jgi:hypothetical protein